MDSIKQMSPTARQYEWMGLHGKFSWLQNYKRFQRIGDPDNYPEFLNTDLKWSYLANRITHIDRLWDVLYRIQTETEDKTHYSQIAAYFIVHAQEGTQLRKEWQAIHSTDTVGRNKYMKKIINKGKGKAIKTTTL